MILKLRRVLVPSTNGRPGNAQPARFEENTMCRATDFVNSSLLPSTTIPATQPSNMSRFRRIAFKSFTYSRLMPDSPSSIANRSLFPCRSAAAASSAVSISSYSYPSSAKSSTLLRRIVFCSSLQRGWIKVICLFIQVIYLNFSKDFLSSDRRVRFVRRVCHP